MLVELRNIHIIQIEEINRDFELINREIAFVLLNKIKKDKRLHVTIHVK